MPTYSVDRAWSDKYIDQTRGIVGELLVRGASFKLDTKESTDLIVQSIQNGIRNGKPVTCFATRLRRPPVFRGKSRYGAPWGYQFTIRSHRDSGAETEYAKLKKGHVDWYLYGHVEQQIIRHWMVLDMDVYREFMDSPAIKTETIRNDDGTEGIAYDVRSFADNIFIGKSETMTIALEQGIDAVEPLPNIPVVQNQLQPPPRLLDLVRRFGGYDKITPTAWAAYQEEVALYKKAIAQGTGWIKASRDRETG